VRQAEEQGEFLKTVRLTAIHASTLRRARQTAAIIGRPGFAKSFAEARDSPGAVRGASSAQSLWDGDGRRCGLGVAHHDTLRPPAGGSAASAARTARASWLWVITCCLRRLCGASAIIAPRHSTRAA
jgi:hypothetical protein